MRTILALALAVLTLLFAAGCGNKAREEAFHDAMDQGLLRSGLLDEYDKYLDKDASIIDPKTRELRKGTSAGLRKNLAEEKRALKD